MVIGQHLVVLYYVNVYSCHGVVNKSAVFLKSFKINEAVKNHYGHFYAAYLLFFVVCKHLPCLFLSLTYVTTLSSNYAHALYSTNLFTVHHTFKGNWNHIVMSYV